MNPPPDDETLAKIQEQIRTAMATLDSAAAILGRYSFTTEWTDRTRYAADQAAGVVIDMHEKLKRKPVRW